jgi:hypothetical protein
MTTFTPISYTYIPTPSCSKSMIAHLKIPLRLFKPHDKNQCIKLGSVALKKPQLLAVVVVVEDIKDK